MEKIAEIVEAQTAEFMAECYELYGFPPLGSLIKTIDGETEIFGIVYRASTSSIEPGRRPIARGKDEPDEESVYRSNPQLSRLLRSEFSSLVVGYREASILFQHLPPTPAHIHSFVYACPPNEVAEFSRSLSFLDVILNAHLEAPVEEIAAAALRELSKVHQDPRRFLVSAGKELSVLMGSDYARLRTLLSRLRVG